MISVCWSRVLSRHLELPSCNRFCRTATSEPRPHSSAFFFWCVALSPGWKLLPLHHFEACIAPEYLVKKRRKTVLVPLDFAFFSVTHARETKSFVRVEHDSRWQLLRVEERLETSLHFQIHPHPFHLSSSVAELRSELFLITPKACQLQLETACHPSDK